MGALAGDGVPDQKVARRQPPGGGGLDDVPEVGDLVEVTR
jgi:hypothetical protein